MSYNSLKKETNFIKKLIADVVSRFGDSLDAVAYSWMVYILTGSASLTALTFAINTLVSVVLSPFSSALVTNWNKKRVIISGDIARGLLVALTALLFLSGTLTPWMVITITALNSFFEAFRNPAGSAIFPAIVSKENYASALSFSAGLTKVAEIVGMALAGVIIGLFGIAFVLFIDAVTFLFSASLLSTLRLQRHDNTGTQSNKGFLDLTRDGIQYMSSNKTILSLCFVAAFLNFALTPLSSLQAAYVSESLQLGASSLSIMGGSLAIGMAVGSFLVPPFLKKWTSFQLLFIGMVGITIGFLFMYLIPSFSNHLKILLLSATFLFIGVNTALANTVIQISFMEKVHPDYLARAMGILTSAVLVATPIASLIIAISLNYFSVLSVILSFGILAVIATSLSLFVKPLRQL